MKSPPDLLEVAVRGWVTPAKQAYATHSPIGADQKPGPSDWVLVFDTETTTDDGQRLRFGAFQLRWRAECHRQGFFYEPSGVTNVELDSLKQAAVDNGWDLLPVTDWIEEPLFGAAVDLSATVVGHNLFFDLTRLAIGHDTSRSRNPKMRRAWSLKLSEDPRRPRVLIKKASPSATFIEFTEPDGRSPEQRQREKDADSPPFRGFFGDTSGLATAFLGGRWTLGRLADTLSTEHRKTTADLDGPINFELMGYAMNDVTVTWECFVKLRDRYDSYHLDVPLHRIYSEASVGKAHLAKMGIRP